MRKGVKHRRGVSSQFDYKIEINKYINSIIITINQMDYSNKTRDELIAICKDNNIKGYSGKKRDGILELINSYNASQKQDTGKFRTNNKIYESR